VGGDGGSKFIDGGGGWDMRAACFCDGVGLTGGLATLGST
jgi:hypothetical protein